MWTSRSRYPSDSLLGCGYVAMSFIVDGFDGIKVDCYALAELCPLLSAILVNYLPNVVVVILTT